MTQEEKAKAYDEALTIAKRIISKNCSEVEKLCLKSIFPELAESEDEKMINELQGFLDSFGADYFGTGEWQKFHDWLEKQKEQKPAWSEEDEEHFLALSIDDIEKIHVFLYAVKNNKQGIFTFTRLSDEQYKEVLRRFKEAKK